MNSSVGAWAPPEAGMYCPVLLSLACSWPVTSTIGLVPGPDSRPGAPVTCGSLVKIVTAVPGCQVRLASWVRYCLATPKSSATMALASRKYLTTSSGLQPGCGGRTSSPQQGPAPGGGAGAEAGCGPLPEGMTEHPPASVTAAASPVTRAAQPRGRRAAARRGAGIAAPRAGAALRGVWPPDPRAAPAAATGNPNVAALTVPARVVQRVARHPLHPAPVHFGDALAGRQAELDPGPPLGGKLLRVRSRAQDQVAHVRGLGVQRRHVRVVPADLQQVREQRFEPFELALQQLRGSAGRGGLGLPGAAQRVARGPGGWE